MTKLYYKDFAEALYMQIHFDIKFENATFEMSFSKANVSAMVISSNWNNVTHLFLNTICKIKLYNQPSIIKAGKDINYECN